MQGAQNKQKGVALISVLLVVAILVAVTTRLLAGHSLVVNHHQFTFEHDQALQYALGAESLARQILYEDFINSGKDRDHLGETWARQSMPLQIDEVGFVEARITDLNRCFNLNSLSAGSSKEVKTNMERLKLMLRYLQINEYLADRLKDWVDSDNKVTGFGAEETTYLNRMPGFHTPDMPINHLSELFLLEDISAEDLRQLLPHVCLIPSQENKINLNTANTLTLASLDNGIGLANAEVVVSSPREYQSVAEFIRSNVDFSAVSSDLVVESVFFQLHVMASVGDSSVTLLSTFRRDPADGKITLLQRDFGKLFRSVISLAEESEEAI